MGKVFAKSGGGGTYGSTIEITASSLNDIKLALQFEETVTEEYARKNRYASAEDLAKASSLSVISARAKLLAGERAGALEFVWVKLPRSRLPYKFYRAKKKST